VGWRRFARERPRRREIERWFGRGELWNIAVVLGPVSAGLCVRDFDEKDAYYDWTVSQSELAQRLPTSRPGRGLHVFFTTDGQDHSLSGKGVLKLPDGELRVRNCYVALPPSHHPNGGKYTWVREPFHGIPTVYAVAVVGLISAVSKSGFGRARARSVQPCHSMPLQFQVGRARRALFGDDRRLLVDAFDDLLGWTVPTGPGMRERCLWSLARALKAFEETRYLRIDDLEPLVRYWWQLALPKVKTKEWFETWAAFARCWERAVVPFGEGSQRMSEILERARRAGCPPEFRDRYGADVCGLVAAICRELASESEDGTFFLDCRTLGRLCGISWSKSAACMRALAASRVIRRIGDPAPGQAATYRYLLGGRTEHR
jgi:hypothetical protein